MPKTKEFSLYDAFSDHIFGGSQAAILLNAADVDQPTRILIAKELGYPATVFVSDVNDNEISVQFYSTVAELPMCGHGTVALMACLSDLGLIDWQTKSIQNIKLMLPKGTANVIVSQEADNKTLAMLEVEVAAFKNDSVNVDSLCHALGIQYESLSKIYPVETAEADFTHLVVPVNSLEIMAELQPDFTAIADFHIDYGIQTVTVICTDTPNSEVAVRIRDFCPAVGVSESAAAGTTNAAVAGYLFRHQFLETTSGGTIDLIAEQGIELNRPSKIQSRLYVKNGIIESQWVGGVAAKLASGILELN